MNALKRNWREAATLIILGKNGSQSRNFDYKILVFKRTDKTHFFAKSICFPENPTNPVWVQSSILYNLGGALDKSDEDLKWLNLFQKHNISSKMLTEKFLGNSTQKPSIFQNNDESRLNREISLRIAANRESFEEVGLAFCNKSIEAIRNGEPFSKTFKELNIPEWQSDIHHKKRSFLELCEQNNVLSDIWNIHEWRTWLTPTTMKRRYETAFFLVTLNDMPEIHPESEHEVEEYMWESPDVLLQLHKDEKLYLPPPQFYEITKLFRFKTLDSVNHHLRTRKYTGNQLFMPLVYAASDGMIFALPGDDLYLKSPNYYETGHNEGEFDGKTLEEVRKMAKNLNRLEHKTAYEVELVCNVDDQMDGNSNVQSKL